MHLKKSVKVGEAELSIETGHMAKQADGSGAADVEVLDVAQLLLESVQRGA